MIDSINDFVLSYSNGLFGPREGGDKYEVNIQKASDSFKKTLYPMVTTGAVAAVKCTDGVVMAADTTGFFGSMARFQDLKHIFKVNDQTIVGVTGDFADFQYLKEIIDHKVINDDCLSDGFNMKPHSLHNWLTRVLYRRRSDFNPLWTNWIVAGWDDGKPFLGVVDKIGLSYTDSCIATGMASYLVVPLLRDYFEKHPTVTVMEARLLMEKAVEVLVYRDARVKTKFQMACVTSQGVEMSPIMVADTKWEIADQATGYE